MKKWLPLAAWVIAIVMVSGASHQLYQLREQTEVQALQATLPPPVWQWEPLRQSDYQSIQARTTLSGSLALEVSDDGLLLRAGLLADYAAWRLILSQILLEYPDIRWQINELCSGQCPDGQAHQVRLQGSRRR